MNNKYRSFEEITKYKAEIDSKDLEKKSSVVITKREETKDYLALWKADRSIDENKGVVILKNDEELKNFIKERGLILNGE